MSCSPVRSHRYLCLHLVRIDRATDIGIVKDRTPKDTNIEPLYDAPTRALLGLFQPSMVDTAGGSFGAHCQQAKHSKVDAIMYILDARECLKEPPPAAERASWFAGLTRGDALSLEHVGAAPDLDPRVDLSSLLTVEQRVQHLRDLYRRPVFLVVTHCDRFSRRYRGHWARALESIVRHARSATGAQVVCVGTACDWTHEYCVAQECGHRYNAKAKVALDALIQQLRELGAGEGQ